MHYSGISERLDHVKIVVLCGMPFLKIACYIDITNDLMATYAECDVIDNNPYGCDCLTVVYNFPLKLTGRVV